VDVGAPGTAAILEILEGAPPEGAANAPDELGVADVIVDMLNGLAGAETQPVEVEAPVEVPFWYVMVHQVEDAEQAAAKQRRAGKLARKLTRQVERAARLLHNIFEAAATDPTVLTRHERPVARLIALLEITPPTDKPGQRMFAGLLRAERRALARAVKEG
jgi:antitoxin (DNA-binding transcriptional repressor) of toxin-antitoxin stability system